MSTSPAFPAEPSSSLVPVEALRIWIRDHEGEQGLDFSEEQPRAFTLNIVDEALVFDLPTSNVS